jgi:hypothetical protein
MNPILVPAPPRSAYNQNRRVSDLLLSQIRHFQHVELKRGDLGIPAAMARDIYTEAGAARYIAAMTHALRGTTVSQPREVDDVRTAAPGKKPPSAVPGLPLPTVSGKITAPAKKSVAKKSAAKRAAKKTPRKK